MMCSSDIYLLNPPWTSVQFKLRFLGLQHQLLGIDCPSILELPVPIHSIKSKHDADLFYQAYSLQHLQRLSAL